MEKYCVKCKHYSYWTGLCKSPNARIDVVTGKHVYTSANVQRGDPHTAPGYCNGGDWFEQKEDKSIIQWLTSKFK